MTSEETQVLIAGAGPVGLVLALELGARGVRCVVVDEAPPERPRHPTANHVSVRSMELLRRHGLADAARHAGFPPDYPDSRVYLTGVGGRELLRYDRPANGARASHPSSPETELWCPKPYFDPVLERAVDAQPSVSLRHATSLESFTQDDAVEATLLDVRSGARTQVRARYLVGCDGARSAVRESLGIGVTGLRLGATLQSVWFRAPKLLDRLGVRATQYWLLGERAAGTLIAIDGARTWRVHLPPAAGDEPLEARLRALCGGVDVEILAAFPWTPALGIARHFARGRVLLAGDAAHQVTPYGGLGMNAGLADAANLGWKLAAALDGWGGAALLESYEHERRGAALALLRYQHFLVEGDGWRWIGRPPFAPIELPPEVDDDGAAGERARDAVAEALRRERFDEFHNDGVDLGARYDASPICEQEDPGPPAQPVSSYAQNSCPGGRAPHAWLADGRSTLDLFGTGFALLRFSGDVTAGREIERAMALRRVPLRSFDLREEAEAASLYQCALALVRPDGYVAWRGDSSPDDALALVDRTRGSA